MTRQPLPLAYHAPPPKKLRGCFTALRMFGYLVLAEMLGSYFYWWVICAGPNPYESQRKLVIYGILSPLLIPLATVVYGIQIFCYESDARSKRIVIVDTSEWLLPIAACFVLLVVLDVLIRRYRRRRSQ